MKQAGEGEKWTLLHLVCLLEPRYPSSPILPGDSTSSSSHSHIYRGGLECIAYVTDSSLYAAGRGMSGVTVTRASPSVVSPYLSAILLLELLGEPCLMHRSPRGFYLKDTVLSGCGL